MDKRTHKSLLNAVKELDSLKVLVETGEYSKQEIADFIEEIQWNVSGILKRREYKSDEFQHRLAGLLQTIKRQKLKIEKLQEEKEEF